MSKVSNLVRDLAKLRDGIAFGEFEPGEATLTLTNQDMGVITYALVNAWISEWLVQTDGYEKTMSELMRVAEEFLVASEMSGITTGLDKLLGKENPEEAADGA